MPYFKETSAQLGGLAEGKLYLQTTTLGEEPSCGTHAGYMSPVNETLLKPPTSTHSLVGRGLTTTSKFPATTA